jgi:hypothetical protein
MTVSSTRHRKSTSERLPSSALNWLSVERRAKRTDSLACSSTCSGIMRNFFCMCSGEVAMKVWMRLRAAGVSTSAARWSPCRWRATASRPSRPYVAGDRLDRFEIRLAMPLRNPPR